MGHVLSERGMTYAVAAIVCGLALWVKLLVGPVVLPGPFSTFLPAVLLAAWAGGIGPGVLATAVSTILALGFVLPAVPMPGGSGWTVILQVATFVATGSVASALVGALRSSRQRLSLAEDLARINRLLREEVTERRAAEAALRESEDRFATAFENAPSGLALVRLTGQTGLTWTNRAFRELIGHEDNALFDRPFAEVIYVDDRPAAMEDLRRLVTGEVNSYRTERRLVHRSGRVFWAHVSVAIVRREDGTPIYFISQIDDIGARKRAETALRESEEKYRDLVENINDVLFAIDRDGVFTYVSPTIRQITGFHPEEVVGRHFSEFVLPQYAPALAAEMREMAAGGAAVPAEFEVHQRSGGSLWVNSLSRPIHVDGTVVGFRGRMSDISARKLAEEALRESEGKFRSLAESTAATIFIQQGNRLAYVNPAAEALTGYSAEELLQIDFWELFDPRFREQVMVRSALRFSGANVPARAIAKIVRRDGQPRWVDFTLTRIEYEGRVAVLGTAIDITERKAAEREARQRQAELAHVLRVGTMDEMAASLAHELNQPLQAMVNFATGCLRRIERGKAVAAELVDPLNQIAKEALRAGEIVRRIRRFVRKAPARRELVDINELVGEATRLFEPEGAAEGATLDVRVERGLPAVEVDSIQIQQVILNLLRNALEAMSSTPAGERVLRVETGVDEGTGGVCVRVIDKGRGFAPEHGELLFEPFYTTKPQGLGMGLSISRSIVEAHGGRLFGLPRPDGGAEFGFVLTVRNQRGATYAA